MPWGWGSSESSGNEWPDPPSGFRVDVGFGGMCAAGSIAGQAPSTGCPCGTTPVKKWYTDPTGYCCKYTACVSNTTAKTTKNNPCRIIA
jgi:hypothetical protein